jgi:hypothetical protein
VLVNGEAVPSGQHIGRRGQGDRHRVEKPLDTLVGDAAGVGGGGGGAIAEVDLVASRPVTPRQLPNIL